MVRQFIARKSSWKPVALVVIGAGALAGCNRPGGVPEELDATAATLGICIGNTGACVADPGSAPADCSQDDTVDTLVLESFDDYAGTNGSAAQDWYTYTDGTSGLNFETYLHEAGTNVASGYEPPIVAPPDSIASCHHSSTSTAPGVLHVFAGPFLGWGGGMGIGTAKLNGRALAYAETKGNGHPTAISMQPSLADPLAPKDNCCMNDALLHKNMQDAGTCEITPDPRYAALCPPPDGEYAVAVGAVDASQYDGVTFWARRGPNSQEGIRVLVGDKYTDDDLNYLALTQQAATGQSQPTYCNRNRECGCLNHQACTVTTQGQLLADLGPSGAGIMGDVNTPVSVCGTTPPAGWSPLNSCTNQLECVGAAGGPSFCCDVSNCNSVYAAYPCDTLPDTGRFAGTGGAGQGGDTQFFGKPCTPYAFENGISSSYCYDPKTDPPPSPPTELCGDFWMTTVDLTTNWQFYKVPFSVLRQQGFAKKSPGLDLHSVSVVRFSWDVGWIDYWLDQVSFYREKTSAAGDP
jgi:hypothetical protein